MLRRGLFPIFQSVIANGVTLDAKGLSYTSSREIRS